MKPSRLCFRRSTTPGAAEEQGFPAVAAKPFLVEFDHAGQALAATAERARGATAAGATADLNALIDVESSSYRYFVPSRREFIANERGQDGRCNDPGDDR